MFDALLEIGTEEIPARFLVDLEKSIDEIVIKCANEYRLKYRKHACFLSPRRISILLYGLEEKTKPEVIEILGPPLKVAKSENGNFLPPAYKFAELYGVKVEELKIKSTPKGEYVSIIKERDGVKVNEVLPSLFRDIILNLEFKKNMVWEKTRLKFARPIRWILALCGTRQVKLEIASVKSQQFTYGLLSVKRKTIKINSPKEYVSKLKSNCIIVDQNDRAEMIKKIARKLANEVDSEPYLPENLLKELTYINEYPVGVLCRFNESFLSLPKEILLCCIIEKQKCIPLVNNGNVRPYFIAIKNGVSENLNITKSGYEAVLNARLCDAEFYFKKDRTHKLEDNVDGLKGVIYYDRIGSMHEKVLRLVKIVEFIAKEVGYNEKKIEHLKRAAYLCKADLLTNMVCEYPELQGVIGKIYAKLDGEDEEVAEAIYEHLLPKYEDSPLPKSFMGKLVALSDKIDTIATMFSLGYKPTGHGDPYGIRKEAFGFLRILIENEFHISNRKLLGVQKGLLQLDFNEEEIINFLKQRFETMMSDGGYKIDEINSVLVNDFDDAAAAYKKIRAINSFRGSNMFNDFLLVYKRIKNILKQAQALGYLDESVTINQEYFVRNEEKDVYTCYLSTKQNVEKYMLQHDYTNVLNELSLLIQPINTLFDKILIIAEDKNLRENRIALIRVIYKVFSSVADFSLIQS